MLKAAYLKESLLFLQVPMEQHATTRESPFEGVCHAAVIKCKCDGNRLLTAKPSVLWLT